MSTSPSRTTSGRARTASGLLRLLLVAAALGAIAAATSGFAVGASPAPQASSPTLGPVEPATSNPTIPVEAAARRAVDAPPPLEQLPSNAVDCSDPAVSCTPTGRVEPAPPDSACRLGGSHAPEGTTRVAPVTASAGGEGRVLRYRVEVEKGLAIDESCFALLIGRILNDPRGWTADGSVSFRQVIGEPDFRLILASPDTTDQLCHPLRTGGEYSCRSRTGVILNVTRWEYGTEEYAADLDTYREYLVNHEVGHLLGHGHVGCPGPGEPAPVMMQQTKGLGECLLNGWPTADER